MLPLALIISANTVHRRDRFDFWHECRANQPNDFRVQITRGF